MDFIHNIPTWLFGIICLFIFVSLALCGLFLTHRRIHHPRNLKTVVIDNGVVGWFFSAILLLYGITLGLIAVATWDGASQASGLASQEAAEIGALYRDLGGYPEPYHTQLRTGLRDYTRFTIEKAWPAQKHGEILSGGTDILDQFQSNLFSFEPKTEGQKIVHAETCRAFNHLTEVRRKRVEAVGTSVPDILWAVVLLGGWLCIVSSYCFHIPHFKLHALMTGGVAAMISLLVFMIASLDRPFRGEVSVSPDAYRLVLQRLMDRT